MTRAPGSHALLLTCLAAAPTLLWGCGGGGSSSSSAGGVAAPVSSVIRVGAASSPKYHAVFDAMGRDFLRQGHEFEFTLYNDFLDLGEGFFGDEVDVAWNGPIGHGRALVRSNGQVLSPIARDVDIQYTSHVVVRKDSGIDTIQDLVGKTFCVGSSESPECNDTPMYYLKKEGIDVTAQCTVVSLDGLVDLEMNDRSTANDILAAITAGQVQAGAMGANSTKALRADPNSPLKVLWISPPYTHCMFTTHASYHPTLLNTFRRVLLSQHMNDPIGREVLVNEGNERIWVDSANERDSGGYEALISSLQGKHLTKVRAPGQLFRIGAVSSTKQINAFRALARYFRKLGEPNLAYVIYGTQRQLDLALHAGRIDLAWNTSLGHARALERTNGGVVAALTRDADMATRFHVVVRKDSGLDALTDLPGKTLVTGNEDAAELSIMPRTLLPQAGLDLSQLTVVSLNGQRDAEWRFIDGPAGVVAAVTSSVGYAGVVDQATADAITGDPTHALKVIYSSTPFPGRVITALSTIDQALLARFRQLMLGMTLADATANTVLTNEDCSSWQVGTNDGYGDLRAAMTLEGTSLTSTR